MGLFLLLSHRERSGTVKLHLSSLVIGRVFVTVNIIMPGKCISYRDIFGDTADLSRSISFLRTVVPQHYLWIGILLNCERGIGIPIQTKLQKGAHLGFDAKISQRIPVDGRFRLVVLDKNKRNRCSL